MVSAPDSDGRENKHVSPPRTTSGLIGSSSNPSAARNPGTHFHLCPCSGIPVAELGERVACKKTSYFTVLVSQSISRYTLTIEVLQAFLKVESPFVPEEDKKKESETSRRWYS